MTWILPEQHLLVTSPWAICAAVSQLLSSGTLQILHRWFNRCHKVAWDCVYIYVYKREPNCDRTTRTNLHQWALNSLIGQTACLMTKWERKWACWSERKTETDHVRHSCAHVNKAVEFHYMNLLAWLITEFRGGQAFSEKRFTGPFDLEVDGELRVGGRLHFSLLPSEPYKNKNYD